MLGLVTPALGLTFKKEELLELTALYRRHQLQALGADLDAAIVGL